MGSLQAVIDEDNLPLLDLQDQQLGKIKALIVEIGNNAGQIVLYKTMAPINIFGRSSFFLKKSATRLEKLDDEFLRVSANFQLMRLDGELLVIDLSTIEKVFGPFIQKNIPSETVISFCRSFPALAGRIRFNENGDKVLLDTKVSKDLFINLLMDNYLTSELTELHYASVAKDSVDAETED